MQPITFSEFQQQAMHGNVIPVAESFLADLLTPVGAFLKLCGPNGDGFLLESVEGGEKLARYSFIGFHPQKNIRFDGDKIQISTPAGTTHLQTDIFNFLDKEIQKYKPVPNPELPRFCGGMVGYFGYDLVRSIEKLPGKYIPTPEHPVLNLGLYDTILAFDHISHQIIIIANAILNEGEELRKSYNDALHRIEQVKEALNRPLSLPQTNQNGHASVQSNFSEMEFVNAVKSAKSYIKSGDIFQVVLSQQFQRAVSAEPIQIYRALRIINPSPYLYFLRQGNHSIIGSSPELLVRVENREVVVRPIAGTRSRGRTPQDDERLAKELLADEKELAEHSMLLDLGRNDVGRVSEYATVDISEKMAIEKYSHVMHIVSEVRGKLRAGMSALDALKASFPAGTVSGAPKVRAMEIIDDLEPTHRGLYAGALGYIDFSGNIDTCITIRTLEVRNKTAYFQAGAGIVADSVPEREYLETVHKSNALRAAIALAEGGLSLK
jgi:anthranilate synthase component 1